MLTPIEALDRALAQPIKIVRAGHPVLHRKAADVDAALFNTSVLDKLVSIMVSTMRQEPGVGLAAPQIAVPLRVLVMEDKPEYIDKLSPAARKHTGRVPLPLTVLVNPAINVSPGTEQVSFREGCLSVPGYSAEVTRALTCEVRAFNPQGELVSLSLAGWPARIVQHEIDHLDGMLYVQRMQPSTFAANQV